MTRATWFSLMKNWSVKSPCRACRKTAAARLMPVTPRCSRAGRSRRSNFYGARTALSAQTPSQLLADKAVRAPFFLLRDGAVEFLRRGNIRVAKREGRGVREDRNPEIGRAHV